MSTESEEPTPRLERYGGGGTNGVYENNYVHAALTDRVICVFEFWLCCDDVCSSYVAAKRKRIYEQVHVCMYVRVTLTLQHVLLLTLEGMMMPFLVVPTAVETNVVRTRRDSNPKRHFSGDEICAFSPSLVMPHGAFLPRLLCRERPRACVMC